MLGNLLRAEFSRLLYRRRATYSLVLILALGMLLPTQWMPYGGPVTEEERGWAHEAYLDCLSFESDPTACVESDFLRVPMTFADAVSGMGTNVFLLAFVAFMVVVTYVGSDFSSGALATQLTFTPRRWAVLLSRTVAASALGAGLMAVGVLASSGVTVVWYMAMFGFGTVDPAVGLLVLIGLSVLYGALLGTIAALAVFVFNGTVAAAAASLGAVVLSLAGDLFAYDLYDVGSAGSALRYLAPIWQGVALFDPSQVEWVFGPGVASRLMALCYHLAVIGVLLALALPLFERRDIKG